MSSTVVVRDATERSPTAGIRSHSPQPHSPAGPRRSRAETVYSSRRQSHNTPRHSVTMPHALPMPASDNEWLTIVKQEIQLVFGFGAAIFFMAWGDHHKLEHELSTGLFIFCFTWIFLQALWLAFAVVRHADCLAVQLGEPYGTLILTLSVIIIEVIMMVALMVTGDEPTLARDTMFAIIMIVLNGMLGVTLLLGAWRHSQQDYNLTSARTFLNVLLPLGLLSLVIPRFTNSAPRGEVSTGHAVFLVGQSVVLYCVFLAVQTMRHPDFFMFSHSRPSRASPPPPPLPDVRDLEAGAVDNYLGQEPSSPLSNTVRTSHDHALAQEVRDVADQNKRLTRHVTFLTQQVLGLRQQSQQSLVSMEGVTSPADSPAESPIRRALERPEQEALLPPPRSEADSHAGLVIRSIKFHVALLILSMAPISMLAEKLAILVERVVDDAGAPNALAGFFVATIVLSPEGMGAGRAAVHNKVQRTVNIALGSALSTIGLTVPAVMTIHLITGKKVELGLGMVECVELLTTFLVTMVTFSGKSTNVLHGVVHMVLFFSYVVLMFDDKDEDNAPVA